MSNPTGESPRVMLVEDAPSLRHAFARLLRIYGYDVLEVSDGQEALDRLADFRPRVVMTDLMMPVMGGIELISRIRADPRNAGVMVLVVTADVTEQVLSMARRAGAADVVAKPLDMPELLARLKALVPEPAL